jgi:hypothetical protein
MLHRSAVLLATLVFAPILTSCASAVVPGSDAAATGDGTTGRDSSMTCPLPRGGTCPVGSTCPAGDGCNSCSCASNGSAACTELACPPVDAGRAPCRSSSDCTSAQICEGMPGCGTPWFCEPSHACTTLAATYCDCNGVTFTAGGCPGRPIAHNGACEMPPPIDAGTAGSFTCGPLRCTRGSQYCEVQSSDTGEPDTYECLAFPPSCSSRGCGCLHGIRCGDTCTTTPDGNIETHCLGG